MAANKFATMLHRNTNKITLILVYAVLEWILIVLLLLNSLFSYLIIKFADYFGLKRPCLLCSRLDHFFEPVKFQNSYRSLICEAHAMDISKLGYCSNHRKLAEWQDMCEDCSSSPQAEFSNKFAFLLWMKKLGVVQDCGGDKVSENVEVISKCACCCASVETKLCCPDNYLMNPSWGDLENTQKGNFILEAEADDKIDEEDNSDKKRSGFVCDRCGEEQGIDKNREVESRNCEEKTEENFSCFVSSFDCKEMVADKSDKDEIFMEKEQESVKKDDLNVTVDDPPCDQAMTVQAGCNKDISSEIQPQHLEFYIDQDACHLIPIELMDSSHMEKQISHRNEKREEENCGNEDFVLEFDKHVGTRYELVFEDRINLDEKVPLLPIQESEEENMVDELESREFNENENSLGAHADCELLKEDFEQFAIAPSTQTPTSNGDNVQERSETAEEEIESDKNQVSEEVLQMQIDEIEADISVGTEIPDHEPIEDFQSEEVPASCLSITEDPSTGNANYHAYDDHESNDIEEDKIPDTPTSVDSLHHLHKKLLLLERKESGTEESLDGSVISDIEAGDGVLTVEKLKSALKAERKALNALYAELEEERSASAVAANQTMAMINRLQEEKAAMQMEALQYQRMMEEQSEYDQEALQLLNELMVKREKERAELEKELEVYRKKVQDYEAKEKLTMLKRRKERGTSGTSSASCSNAEDSDGLSVDLNHEEKEEDGFDNHKETGDQNTPVDAVLYLEESLANFEVERVSILRQLKVLEEKLFTLSDEEKQQHLYKENGNGYIENLDHISEANGVANGNYKEMNGKHHQERKNFGAKAKRLLPLFDAIDAETEDGMQNGYAEGVDSVALLKSVNKFEVESKKLAIEEEVDHVYERLQALEADREFLKHCITSLKKGDKGIELLQEILHHLRDLRSVELRVRNMGDGAL
ncbi:myosin-binding protein 2 isoform X2 [Hevea brasiliensis]|uniref:myosin-binding protein 2 isoform X2 n=1 Tax=Hevea brasiliensis TaxID=3981 RepID=UPI0025E96C49|nr:myosin-binding protein 2 isoform X2 [Hevea brasiliensis]